MQGHYLKIVHIGIISAKEYKIAGCETLDEAIDAALLIENEENGKGYDRRHVKAAFTSEQFVFCKPEPPAQKETSK